MKCAALLVVIKGANDKVCGIPSTVEEFVEFTAALAKITDEQVQRLVPIVSFVLCTSCDAFVHVFHSLKSDTLTFSYSN